MLTLVLAESELELVPPQLAGHPQVVAAARRAGRKPNRMLLDGSLHHAAMRHLESGDRRGRPDIVHLFLLTALESRANRAGRLAVHVHTRHDEWIRIDPATRLMRNYTRFCGLMEQLLDKAAVPTEGQLLRVDAGWSLGAILKEIAPDRLLWLDEAAPTRPPGSLFATQDLDRHVVAAVGGFPHGVWRTPAPAEAERIGFGREPLSIWTVAAELAVHYQNVADKA